MSTTDTTKGAFAFILLLGILSWLSLLGVNSMVIGWVKESPWQPSQLANLGTAQLIIMITACLFSAIGVLLYRKHQRGSLTVNEKRASRIVRMMMLLWCFLMAEGLLHVDPLPTRAQHLSMSVPYEAAPYAQSVFPKGHVEVLEHDLRTVKFELNNGFHSPALPAVKPADEIRVVVLGGSFIFADYTESTWERINEGYDRNWILRAQRLLHEQGHPNIRIINAGIPGHNSDDSYGRLNHEIAEHDPDYVLVCHGWNDIKYFRRLTPDSTVAQITERVNVDAYAQPSGFRNFVENSQIVVRLSSIFMEEMEYLEGGHYYQDATDTYPKHGLEQFRKTYQNIISLCTEIGATPVLMTQPTLLSNENSEADKNRMDLSYVGLTHSGTLAAYNDIVMVQKTLSADSTVHLIDMRGAMSGVSKYFYDHVHLVEAGSKYAAQFLADEILRVIEESTSQ